MLHTKIDFAERTTAGEEEAEPLLPSGELKQAY
jgi:hypothetical protein